MQRRQQPQTIACVMRAVSRRRLLRVAGLAALAVSTARLMPVGAISSRQGQTPLLHHIHPDHLIGDVHPYFYDGVWYAYYLRPGFQSRLMTSTDLLRWTEIDLTHVPTNAANPELSPYFVLNVFRDEALGVFRTYHGWSAGVMVSHTSADLLRWDFAPDTYRVPQQSRYLQQRDPYVFWNPVEQAYWCIMTCKVAGYPDDRSGAIGFASSTDLQRWQKRGDLLFPENMREPEVPQTFQIGQYWYLIASVLTTFGVGGTSCWRAVVPTGPWEPIPPLDGADFSAANAGFDGRRWLLLGWIPLTTVPAHGQYTWAGHLGLPRELFAQSDGTLAVRLPAEIAGAIRGTTLYAQGDSILEFESGAWKATDAAWTVDPTERGVMWLPGTYGRFDLTVECVLSPDQKRFGVVLESGDVSAQIALDSFNQRLVTTSRTNASPIRTFSESPLAFGDVPHRCRLIVEADIVELFVDDSYSLTTRLPMALESPRIGLFAWDGRVTVRHLAVHHLNAVSELGQ